MELAARNQTRDTVLATPPRVADGLWGKFMGLMGRPSLAPDAGLWLPDSNGIHMMFMRFPIDAVFVGRRDAAGACQVVSVHRDLRDVGGPRAARPRRPRRPGTAGRHDRTVRDQVGDTIVLAPAAGAVGAAG